jgi:hypothetical protein
MKEKGDGAHTVLPGFASLANVPTRRWSAMHPPGLSILAFHLILPNPKNLSPHASPHRSIETTLAQLLLFVSLVKVVEQTMLDESRERASVSFSVAVAVLLLLVVVVVVVVVVVTDGASWWCACKNDVLKEDAVSGQKKSPPS